jgi:acetoin:2,6-dichlorophenolindophenol oxidoreductase subunit alpha
LIQSQPGSFISFSKILYGGKLARRGMEPDYWRLYEMMKRSRLYEEEVARLWHEGRISGEMHLGLGEEAIIAGIVSHLKEGDALALDHRGTAALLMRGVDPVTLLREMLGFPNGLCRGCGGHMHLFSPEHLASSSGIVGSAGPAAAGFGLAAQTLRPGTVAVAFFGEGAMNQGMLLESMNLAALWKLPVIFVCKDDGWAITTQPQAATRGSLGDRAAGFGLPYLEVDGRDVKPVWEAARQAIDTARVGRGPSFLHVKCVHLEGHFLGFLLLRLVRKPLAEMPAAMKPLISSLFMLGGSPFRQRLDGVRVVNAVLGATRRDARQKPSNDPLVRARKLLASEPERIRKLEASIKDEVRGIVNQALEAGAA